MEIGNNKENLILKTAGKIKILWGSKFIDLLDNNGKLNFKHQQIIKTADDIESITSNGIYVVEDTLIIKYGDLQFTLEESSVSKLTDLIEEMKTQIEKLQSEIEDLKDEVKNNSYEPVDDDSSSDDE